MNIMQPARPEAERRAETSFAGLVEANPLAAYLVDSWQRSVLFLDVLRQRGNQHLDHTAQVAPHVLQFAVEVVVDGRTLARPVNYGLVRIVPQAGAEPDPRSRPVVVFDPRAGHGPGIGGFKADSEIGMAMRAGHPCYFVGFLPEPVPGQTIEDIMAAEAVFMETVIARHPQAEGRPFVVGNCQAGWAVLMVAAARPELFGPILVAGAPISYWAGKRGENPMRYTGGLAGGSWQVAMAADLGNGVFDGAHLVNNFENLNPSNTLWSKQYELYAKIDTEAERYLGFERWWGGHVLLNAEEIQWIVDNLFIGNRLATAELVTKDGVRLDLRNIKTPIICFCSKGDNITPPQQALGWIPDLYDTVDDIRANGQTIVYCIHDSIGHLGIFVSGKVATKEHREFAHNIDFIDCLPPGLYEAIITPLPPEDPGAELGIGEYAIRFVGRQPKDILALGGNDLDDERAFAAVRRVSEINLGLYRTFLQPWVRSIANPTLAETLRVLHPARLQYTLFSDRNPFLAPIGPLAEQVRAQRDPALARDNPFRQLERTTSEQIVAALDAWRDLRDQLQETTFFAIYGSPLVQALLGLRASDEPPRYRPGRQPEELRFVQQQIEALEAKVREGDARIGVLRALLWLALEERTADERSFEVLRRLRAEHGNVPLDVFKRVVRDQFSMLVVAGREALEAIRGMLPEDVEQRRRAFAIVRQVVEVAGGSTPEREQRLAVLARIFEVEPRGGATSAGAAAATAEAGPGTGPESTAAKAAGRARAATAAGGR
ncbi:MAG: DUF3141 domain-containing protein [Geminicoccaceae bacterium]|nr:DUF3141 domain-containing protein [Geminicoccaceae bacterium]